MNTESKNRPKVILLFGPTGVGKTDLLDRLFSGRGEIISADSMQVYRGMDVGSAKPPKDLVSRLPHHLVDIQNPDQQFHAGDFLALADTAAKRIIGGGKIPVLSGGTAFYFKNFIYGLPDTPPSDPQIRLVLEEERRRRGLPVLYEELQEADPAAAARIAPQDGYRIQRALEVIRSTRRALSSFHVPSVPRNHYDLLIIGLDRPREELYRRIDLRVNQMMEQGLEDEVKRLIRAGYTEGDPGMQGIGYREFFTARRRGCMNRSLIIREIQQNSRHYAKRQLTFFRAFAGAEWYHPDQEQALSERVDRFLRKPGTESYPG